MPATARRMLATVNSSATIERQPEVPNLMGVVIRSPFKSCTVILPHASQDSKRRVSSLDLPRAAKTEKSSHLVCFFIGQFACHGCIVESESRMLKAEEGLEVHSAIGGAGAEDAAESRRGAKER